MGAVSQRQRGCKACKARDSGQLVRRGGDAFAVEQDMRDRRIRKL